MGTPLHTRNKTIKYAVETCYISIPKKFQVQRSAGKVMATVFWDITSILLLDFLERNHTVTDQHYSDQPEEQLHPSIRSKRRGLLSKGVMLQHDNARAHTANVTSSTITKLGWEVLVHPPIQSRFGTKRLSLVWTSPGSLGWNKV